MTTLQTLEMALEALKDASYCVQNDYLPDKMGHDWDEVIAALRQQIALEKMADNERELGIQMKPADEPVAFQIFKPTPPRLAIPNVRDAELPWVYDQDPSSGNVASMWVTPVSRPQPAAQFAGSYGTIDESAAKRIATALGWEPKREWVGLTEEEIVLVCAECAASAHRHDDINYARAIEAKLKEKNT